MVGDGGLAYSSSVLGCRVRTYPLRRGGDSPWHKMREESAEGGTKFCFLTYNSLSAMIKLSSIHLRKNTNCTATRTYCISAMKFLFCVQNLAFL